MSGEVSESARTLLRGAVDTHVHIAPDVVPRRIDDVTLARRFAELGLGGFQLKSHYTSTAERAAVVRPSQDLPVEDQAALASRGALLERCFTTPHTGTVAWERVYETIRATGPEHSVLATDLGETANPPVEDGLGLWSDRLLAAGFDEEEVHVMALVNTRRVAGVSG
jgi:hypothetical protein